ncbi:NAD-dependent succinate-semialdehyde dehydrogenase [Mesorhizobium sp. B2-4-15]|uniref:NAD-dependent succinate-semialdehyde dehydrogenase n=1 Tax=Mesorhizobium sp. B2-4-15 TaxID=2589934 RepID=UPI00114DC6B6|nr:NAD-dependent succinate-semialdehyde dehydrogenase [Mesorhizobium sp. B2-4-15]TPK73603.1 NAD-dependent succinate-semialdehyde dehydrogenase [Mesorhizobium sp. B2-4-15]
MQDYPEFGPIIGGQRLNAAGRQTIPVENPATLEVLNHLVLATTDDLDAALACSARGFYAWRRTSALERGRILRASAQLLRERSDLIARTMTLEQGKVLAESKAEIAGVADIFDWCAEEGRRTYGRVIPGREDGQHFEIRREPIGPVAAFSAWNFPMNLPARKIANALAAGCSVILKPSEETPGTAFLLVQACLDAGVPGDVLSLVFGDPPKISEHLIASPIIRKASITGSIAAGRAVGMLCGKYIKRCTLELGGHAAIAVFSDIDVQTVVAKLAATKFRNGGQVCVSPTRFYVQDRVYDQFVDRFTAFAKNLRVGNGLAPESQMGPLANARQIGSIEAIVADAVRKGATVAAGGKRINNIGHFYEPTVLVDVPDDAAILGDEPFGPVAPILRFSEAEEFVAKANSLEYGLASSVFSNDLTVTRYVSDRLEVGMVGVNEAAYGLAETPVCGVKASGHGHEGGIEGIADHMVTKFINERVQYSA